MTPINEPPPAVPAARVAVTAAHCPACDQTGVIENVVHARRLRTCTWCGACWEPPPVDSS
jgi:hypothetical protein